MFKTVSGWTSLMAAVALVGGTQLLVLGVIGEYLGRLYDQSKGRPLFIIQDVLRSERDDVGGNGVTSPEGSGRSQEAAPA
jgi:dolichol-phosphate mannosyltransferase